METSQKRNPTERLEVQRRIDHLISGERPPAEEPKHPYITPTYSLLFPHIGTQRQLFLDNFMLDKLEGVGLSLSGAPSRAGIGHDDGRPALGAVHRRPASRGAPRPV